ncbi:hypothetical protein NM688_g4044 [Phlebia brevispora]|uniref:Uncharacterized protein n=1 Tax=Phlebia brevispora TaxID=194682 RepID=A0ACC1T493_9APHY|nr:hypothetical protein NM688_g4044 [Phlebia brevispora]
MYGFSIFLYLGFAMVLYVIMWFMPSFSEVDLGSVIGHACVAENVDGMSFIWIPVLTFEIVMFPLAAYEALKQFKDGAWQACRLMQVMFRDSFAYFLLIVALNVTNLIVWIHVRDTLLSTTFTFHWIIDVNPRLSNVDEHSFGGTFRNSEGGH